MNEIPGPEFGESDPVLDLAVHAVLYRDLETASETFAMHEALTLVLGSIGTGVELDRERLGRLVEMFDDGPQLEAKYDENGTLIYYDEKGDEVKREAPSPQVYEYFQEQKARKHCIDEFVATRAPEHIATVLSQLAEPDCSEAIVSVLVKRGQREGAVGQNELEIAALNSVRDELRGSGHTVKEEHTRVGSDGTSQRTKSKLTHTLHSLFVSKA